MQEDWGAIEAERTGERTRRKKHHMMDVDALCREAQDRLLELRGEDEEPREKLFRFRLAGKVRLWGIRRGDMFELIWYDRDHEVYPQN